MRRYINKFMLSVFFVLISFVAYSQGNSQNNPGKKPPNPHSPPPPVGLPIDGGLSFLIISGVAYGVYELRRKK